MVVSLNSRLESHQEEEAVQGHLARLGSSVCALQPRCMRPAVMWPCQFLALYAGTWCVSFSSVWRTGILRFFFFCASAICCCFAVRPSTWGGVFLISEMGPLGGSRGFRRPQILGCYVAKFALHEALKLIV